MVDAIINQKDVFIEARTILERQYLEKLPVAAAASFNCYDRRHDSDCIQNTRVELLQEIKNWADGGDDRPIFWLRGLAGTGKSTIARTIAHYYHDRRRLAASFFFSRDIGGDVRHARKFFTSIAAQLANSSDSLGDHICDAIKRNGEIVNRAPQDQWRQLVLEPLLKRKNAAPQLSLVLVVDALDECENNEDIRTIVHLLSETRLLRKVRLRVLITSRPEISIRDGFARLPGTDHHDFVLHDISPSILNEDIRVFVEHNFNTIRQLHGYALNWPGVKSIRAIVEHAAGLFIWAATACRFIKNGGRFTEKRLSAILDGNVCTTAPDKSLDEIYLTVLENSIQADFDEEEEREHCSMLREVLGAIVILFSSLSISSLAKLVNVPGKDIDESFADLHAILDIPNDGDLPIRLHHPSFRDFLVNRKRCNDLRFWVNERKAHRLLADYCIDLMSMELKRDTCDLQEPGIIARDVSKQKIETDLPAALQYACQYWVQHLMRSDTQLEDYNKTHNFLLQHLLHWFEALSLIGKIADGVNKSPSLHSFVHDSRRFILYNRSIIEEAPIQTYFSALLFAPQRSLVRKQFEKEMPCWFKRLPEVQYEWGSLLQTLEGHSESVFAVVFSPDGKLVASASFDGTVKLWDVATGAVLQTLEEHTCSRMAFSLKGEPVGFASCDETVRLWNAITGVALQVLEGHTSYVNAVVFSPDGKLVASASGDGTVRLWDAATGAILQTLDGHSGMVKAVTFSLDGKLVASASSDGIVRLWDAKTGAALHMLEGHTSYVNAISFSPDGRLVASASGDGTVRLWDAATGSFLQTLKFHTSYVSAIAFSPHGKLAASVSGDGTVRLWDAAIGADPQRPKGHAAPVCAVVFSPDGNLVASASHDKRVIVWDVATGSALQTLQGHTAPVYAVVYSPDGKLVASGSRDRTVRIWDITTGVTLKTLKGHTGPIGAVAFSPDGKLVASGSQRVRLWDAATGAALHTLEGRIIPISAVVFSPDGMLVTSASGDERVRLWDVATGATLQMLDGHSGMVNAVTFSLDGKLVASASQDKTVRVWDAAAGVTMQTLKGHTGSIAANVCFSGVAPYLETDRGSLYMASSSSIAFASNTKLLSTVCVRGNWITQGHKKILWLPPDYRPLCSAFKGHLFVLGYQSGSVIFLEFNF
ncbi:putative WD-repeat protein [Zopfia rhizophila CBS 207.26]|uniref:Mitochondrial division protein 1 n=1 Tax=Zopfia rhizophila CBS 207.26 TaxID=1314779 RepID=A0A6A6DVE8_9PEZI|nr:putative WD-repeat protein [Zopfia rhizophila CBS 207.26]